MRRLRIIIGRLFLDLGGFILPRPERPAQRSNGKTIHPYRIPTRPR